MKRGDIVFPYVFAFIHILGTIVDESDMTGKDWTVSFYTRFTGEFTVDFAEDELELVGRGSYEGV